MALDFGEFFYKTSQNVLLPYTSRFSEKNTFLVYFKFRQNRPGVIFFGECWQNSILHRR